MILFKVSQAISRGLAPLTLIGAALAYWSPSFWLPFGNSIQWLFALTMFSIGLVIKPEELAETGRHPKRIGLGVLTQFSVMPLLGTAAAYLAGLPPQLALGFILVGCAPGAMASNVIVYLAGGAVAFSVALTTVATFLSPLLTPLLVQQLGGALMQIDFIGMMVTILLTVVLPLAAGMGVHRMTSDGVNRLAKELAPAIAALAIVIICAYAVAANQQRIAQVGAIVVVLVIVMNAMGYILGWNLARLYRFDHQHRMTLSIEIGMQNAGMGVVLATTQFREYPETALPAALFAFWCVLTAAGATTYFRRQGRKQALLST